MFFFYLCVIYVVFSFSALNNGLYIKHLSFIYIYLKFFTYNYFFLFIFKVIPLSKSFLLNKLTSTLHYIICHN